ncbi:unnamed protein product [Oncorhynchus mykiss]|uniref:Phosphorylase b kinase regulatory subunit n=1 Tax=Oncorhynchus mykiss TaxID=8022 RepID=A0A060W2B7_ONCMY|nr:unnamed protein product [Oncorhynchus mykiss]
MASSECEISKAPRKLKRYGSIYEPLKLSILHREDEPLWEKLDRYYNAVKTTILNYQSPTTGLFPTKTCSSCKEAKVRDSLYCAASSWALGLAYRRIDDDMGRTHELEHSAIKCMRGILYCYMRQSDKVEQFKQDPSPSKCLHSIFNVDTGDEILSYNDYHHLQIDALSLFLLYLVEMICSGLQIIYNTDEISRPGPFAEKQPQSMMFPPLCFTVSFIQNLVFCVERAYRVPDFGMWERGSKYNNGSTELHSSSVGLAKAALEAINGFNLFGNQGCSWSVIFVDLDAHNRNRQTLSSLLPRESRSHNTDAALLPCISYPAFAVDDDALYSQTLDKVVRKLKGKYGFKRFLRDGYRTANEDKNRRHYKPAEMKGPIDNDTVVHVALIAESQRLQVFLNTYGIQTQTPQQVEPIQIWAQKELVNAYRFLAINKKLGLSGRPERPVGCMGTCKIYRILGKTVVCYPIVFDLSDFYLSQDVMLLIDDIKNALQFIKHSWKMKGRPLFLVLIREDNIKGSRFNPVLDMLASFKKGSVGGVKVHVDRLQTLISGAIVEQLDFLRVNEEEIPEFKNFQELEMPKHSKVKRQTSTPNASNLEQQPEIDIEEWKHKSTNEIMQKFYDCDCLASQAQLASILMKKEGPDFFANDETLMEDMERLYRIAGTRKLWLAVRYAAAVIKKFASSIAPHITTLVVHGKQVME